MEHIYPELSWPGTELPLYSDQVYLRSAQLLASVLYSLFTFEFNTYRAPRIWKPGECLKVHDFSLPTSPSTTGAVSAKFRKKRMNLWWFCIFFMYVCLCHLLIYCFWATYPSFFALLCDPGVILQTSFLLCQLAWCEALSTDGIGETLQNWKRKKGLFLLPVFCFSTWWQMDPHAGALAVVCGEEDGPWFSRKQSLMHVNTLFPQRSESQPCRAFPLSLSSLITFLSALRVVTLSVVTTWEFSFISFSS